MGLDPKARALVFETIGALNAAGPHGPARRAERPRRTADRAPRRGDGRGRRGAGGRGGRPARRSEGGRALPRRARALGAVAGAAALARAIVCWIIRPVRPTVTLRDVARLARVHPATASRALNAETRALVNDETAQRVIEAARGARLPAQPDRARAEDQPLRHGRRRHPGPHQPALPADRARDRGAPRPAGLHVADRQHRQRPGAASRIDRGDALAPGRRASSWPPRGSTTRCWSSRTPRACRSCWSTAAWRIDVPAVTADDAAGMRSRSRTSPRSGHRRIAHLGRARQTPRPASRPYGVPRRGPRPSAPTRPAPGRLRRRAGPRREGARALRELLDARTDFTAIVAGNDLIALGCYDVLAERGLRCPDDVSAWSASTTCRSPTASARR